MVRRRGHFQTPGKKNTSETQRTAPKAPIRPNVHVHLITSLPLKTPQLSFVHHGNQRTLNLGIRLKLPKQTTAPARYQNNTAFF